MSEECDHDGYSQTAVYRGEDVSVFRCEICEEISVSIKSEDGEYGTFSTSMLFKAATVYLAMNKIGLVHRKIKS